MLHEVAIAVLIAFGTSALLTWRVRALALTRGMLDIPNERSSHQMPTPRGGGLAIVISTTLVLAPLALAGVVRRDLAFALLGGGAMVAVIGLMDDRRQLSARLRLAVHFAAALWALVWLGGLPPVRIFEHTLSFGVTGYVLGSLGIVWTLNLFNFMDGIDGIAGTEAVFICVAGALLTVVAGASAVVPTVALVFGAACGGFLLWNWPPAKIFMGDVGSGYLGYIIAVLAVGAARENAVLWQVWLLLGGMFFVDATVTLSRRLARGERVQQAHRSHAYQNLAHRWGSHKRVTVAMLVGNSVWLFPCALVATLFPDFATCAALAGLAPLVLVAFAAGSGRGETSSVGADRADS